MPEGISLYKAGTATSEDSHMHNRKLAVEAALEVIRSAALGGALSAGLYYEFDNLAKYADQIQAALERQVPQKP